MEIARNVMVVPVSVKRGYGVVQVSQEMFNILSVKGYKLVIRGAVDVKGKGTMVTYYLEGQSQDAQPVSSQQ